MHNIQRDNAQRDSPTNRRETRDENVRFNTPTRELSLLDELDEEELECIDEFPEEL